MPDPTPQEVVEARESLRRLADLITRAGQPPYNVSFNQLGRNICIVSTLLDEAERVLEPFSNLAHHLADYRDRDHFVSGLTGDVSVKSSEISKAQSLLLKLKGPDHG